MRSEVMADNEFAEEEVLDFDEEQEQQVNLPRRPTIHAGREGSPGRGDDRGVATGGFRGAKKLTEDARAPGSRRACSAGEAFRAALIRARPDPPVARRLMYVRKRGLSGPGLRRAGRWVVFRRNGPAATRLTARRPLSLR